MKKEEVDFCKKLNDNNIILLNDIDRLTKIIKNTRNLRQKNVLIIILECKMNEVNDNAKLINDIVMKYKK